MNGAESLVRTLVAGGVEVCFTNPGTSEMHFVAALDRVEGVRCVLALFEGVATGAADAYGRLAGKPAATLLHLGPGLANGLANLHNASRARSPIVNVVGEHATTHRALDAPLTADIAGIARPYSRWIGTPETPDAVGRLTAEAIRAARAPAPGNIATLILPADASWGEGGVVGKIEAPPPPPRIAENVLHGAVALLRGTGGAAALYLGGPALSEAALVIAGRIAAKLGLQLLAPTQIPRIRRGAGLVSVDRVPYPIDMATERLKDIRRLVLVGAPAPVAFFAYPDKPARTTHPDCVMHKLAGAEDDVVDALARLAESLGADKTPPLVQAPERPGLPRGAFTLPDIARVVAALLPDNAIVVDESVTSGRGLMPATKGCAPHDWLTNPGGSIGFALPGAVGAAVACPKRKVLCLTGDGSAQYTCQALWTMARDNLDVAVVVFANRDYKILKGEFAALGAGNPGRRALDMLEIGRPDIDWVSLAKGYGVPGKRAIDLDSFASALDQALADNGPRLVEVVL